MPRKPSFDPGCLDLDIEPVIETFKPNMISVDHMPLLFRDVPESVKSYARILRDQKGWKFYSVKQNRGRCYYHSDWRSGNNGTITIPAWVIDSHKPGQKIWYIAHEMAHAFNMAFDSHGPGFMEELKRICPAEHLHYELDYKPRNAAAAGITPKGFIDSLDLF